MILDLVILAILGKTIYNGYKDGIVSTIFYILGILLGLVIAWYFYDYTKSLILEYLGLSSIVLTNILAAILPVILVAFLVWRLGDLVGKLIDLLTLGFADKLFGMVLGAIKGLIILGIIFYFLQKLQTYFNWQLLDSSYLYPYIKPVIALLFSMLKGIIPIFKNIYEENITKLQSVFNFIKTQLDNSYCIS